MGAARLRNESTDAALDALRRERGLHPVHDALAKRGLANAGEVCRLSQRRPLDRRREHGRLLIRRQRAERLDHLGHLALRHALRCRLIARKPVLVDLERSIKLLRGLGARPAKHAAVAALLRLRGQVFLHGRRLSSCTGDLELLNCLLELLLQPHTLLLLRLLGFVAKMPLGLDGSPSAPPSAVAVVAIAARTLLRRAP